MTGEVSITDVDATLKEYYSPDGIKDTVYDESGALFGMLPKLENCTGRRYIQPAKYGRNSGRSRVFTKAQQNRSANRYVDFIVPWVEDFGVVSISRRAIKEATGAGAFVDAQKEHVDDMLKGIGRNAGISIFRGSGGMRGQINASYSSGATVTLNDIAEITNWEVGDAVNFSSNNGDTATDTLTQSSGVDLRRVITAIDRDAGTITFDASTGLAASLYMFIEGDFQLSCTGLSGWVPLTAPGSSDSFLGVNRSVDTRLSGTRVTATSVSINEAIKNGLERMGREGAEPNLIVLNTVKARLYELELDSKVVWTDTKIGQTSVSAKTTSIVGPKGKPAQIVVDFNCQDDLIWMLTKESLKVVSIGPVPDMVDNDGVTMLREAGANGFEVRADALYNLAVNDTHANGVIIVESD